MSIEYVLRRDDFDVDQFILYRCEKHEGIRGPTKVENLVAVIHIDFVEEMLCEYDQKIVNDLYKGEEVKVKLKIELEK